MEPWKCPSATPGVPKTQYCAHGWGTLSAEAAAVLLQAQERHQNQAAGKGNHNEINGKEKIPHRYKASTSEEQVLRGLWAACCRGSGA